MKKYIASLAAILLSGTAVAETGLTVGLGYESSSIENNYGLNGDPAGLGINVHYAIPFVDGFFVELDATDYEDESDVGPNETLTINQKRIALKLGYVFALDDTTSITAAIYSADVEWDWEQGRPTEFERFESDDSGVSFIIGVDKEIGNGVTLGTALTLGHETGVEAYTSFAIRDNLDVKISYFKRSYELEFEEFDESGPTGDGSAFGDGDFKFDMSQFRVSASYSF